MDPVVFTIGYFVVVYGWPIYLPVLVLVAGSATGAVVVAIVGAIRSGFRRPEPVEEDVDVAEFFEDEAR
ncbi:hypothetical protein [Leifsonia shinshuensis]|uniref:Uncharacterized protein n=1 Tax=Leifsonia shinshuensis TaxID=150026 RepID=A0A7G6Y961_9MICO|nr:hypothetical protein [Leifsonia shinshuensis]QNE35026.1 hypothetical protein F1C12_07700 [Leifsonia shinshuensis]